MAKDQIAGILHLYKGSYLPGHGQYVTNKYMQMDYFICVLILVVLVYLIFNSNYFVQMSVFAEQTGIDAEHRPLIIIYCCRLPEFSTSVYNSLLE